MRKKRIIASVETCDDGEHNVKVSEDRSVTLRFPNATYTGYSRMDFVKTLTPAEARALGNELVAAADHVTAAEATE